MTAEQRRWTEYLPLDSIEHAARNPKRHHTGLIEASISHHGLVESPTLDERTGRLVAGHGRINDLLRRKADGETPPDGVDIDPDTGDWLVPVQRGWASRSNADADAYLVVSNRSSELGGWENEGLADLLTDIRDSDERLLELTGYDQGDLDDLRKLSEAPDLDGLGDDLGEPGNDDGWPVIRVKAPPHVVAAWNSHLDTHGGAEVAAFAALLKVDPHFAPAVAQWEPDLRK